MDNQELLDVSGVRGFFKNYRGSVRTGWAGNILRVDLGAGSSASEPLNRNWAERYLGQHGLAIKYLAAEVDARVDPLDPANKLIFA